VLDSQKEAPPAEGEAPAEPAPEGEAPAEGEQPAETAPEGEQPAPAEQPAEAAPPPESDEEAQAEEARPERIESITVEEGQRIERPRDFREERREDVEIVREVGDRYIVEFNNNIYVESPDRERLVVDAREVYYEELPRGRTREVIVRPDGTRVVTIRNRYGDILRRSKFTPDDREVVLVYVDERDYDRVLEWRDPGADLPPLRLTIPEEEYILDAEAVEDPEAYYTFLEQPPVERVERTYSIAEVKRSARIRDKVRRVDLDTINFEFGSAEIAESEIADLEGVAQAMERLLEQNPAETFLIEGHTDAVGTDVANLALSDRRAEAVATALSGSFGIPPENLAPQGYGEQYLKVNTEGPERENRRVAIRRITPLVAPVASAQ
jgi:outer membrane protein OmpA-like peptidoglycan-associated protein